jgi:DtxR family Mn-dependent transcriptional regulator
MATATRQARRTTSEAVEDYAKAIYALEARAGTAVTTNDLAHRLGVTAPSASAMIKRLAEHGLVEHELYRGTRLTDSGRRLATRELGAHLAAAMRIDPARA